jgi:hypothetical protein
MYRDDLPELGSNFGVLVDQSFPKGKAMATWLQEVKAAGAAGQVPVHDIANGISWYKDLNPPTQRWVYTDQPAVTEIFSFNTPVGVAAKEQCGRVRRRRSSSSCSSTWPRACSPTRSRPASSARRCPPPPPPPPQIQ